MPNQNIPDNVARQISSARDNPHQLNVRALIDEALRGAERLDCPITHYHLHRAQQVLALPDDRQAVAGDAR